MPDRAGLKQALIRVEEDVMKKVVALAKKEFRTNTQEISYILTKYIRDYEAENGPVDSE